MDGLFIKPYIIGVSSNPRVAVHDISYYTETDGMDPKASGALTMIVMKSGKIFYVTDYVNTIDNMIEQAVDAYNWKQKHA